MSPSLGSYAECEVHPEAGVPSARGEMGPSHIQFRLTQIWDLCLSLNSESFVSRPISSGVIYNLLTCQNYLVARTFQFYGTREEDVVFEMNMLMQVLLEFPQPVVERVEGRAGVLWGCEVHT